MPEDRPSIRENAGRNPRGVVKSEVVLAGSWPQENDRAVALKSSGSPPRSGELISAPEDEFLASVLDFGLFGKEVRTRDDFYVHLAEKKSSSLDHAARSLLGVLHGVSNDRHYAHKPNPYVLAQVPDYLDPSASILTFQAPVAGTDSLYRPIGTIVKLVKIPSEKAAQFVELVKSRDDGPEITARFFKKAQRNRKTKVVNNNGIPPRLIVIDDELFGDLYARSHRDGAVARWISEDEIEKRAVIKTKTKAEKRGKSAGTTRS